jgi:hypothetical protein
LERRRDAEPERRPVSVNTSHAIAICCIQLPLTDTT